MAEEMIEQTLFIHREVHVYKVPPRTGAGGYKSGEWKVGDKIFDGRLRVIAKGDLCEVRIEEENTGNLFVICPIRKGQRQVCVEPVTDSSRYFVIRVEDPTSGRHAFLGLGFDERGPAFDFNVAISDHEKHIERAHLAQEAAKLGQQGAATSGGVTAGTLSQQDAALLYRQEDMSLKEGQTIRINVKRPSAKAGGGFLSRQGGSSVGLGVPPPGALPAGGNQFGFGAGQSQSGFGLQQPQSQPRPQQQQQQQPPSNWMAFD